MSERESSHHEENITEQVLLQNQKPQQQMDIHSLNVLSLDKKDSLEILGYQSIDNPIPIPKNMLSFDKDAFQPQDRQYQQNQSNRSEFRGDGEPDDLMRCLDLGEFDQSENRNNREEKPQENTKNVLRNFGNAQNHYVLHHERARKRIQRNIRQVGDFDLWVRSLKLENFQNFKKIWTSNKCRLFTRVYKEICWEFYTEQAPSYVLMSSRIRKMETRLSHLKHIYRFLQGLNDPESFTYFKAPEKPNKS